MLGNDGTDKLSGENGDDDCDGGGGNHDTADKTCERIRNVP